MLRLLTALVSERIGERRKKAEVQAFLFLLLVTRTAAVAIWELRSGLRQGFEQWVLNTGLPFSV